MVCKLSNRINAKLEEMYNARFWFLTTIIHAIVFDANNFCNRISQLTQLTSPERLDQMKYVEQREESLQQIVSIPREESLRKFAQKAPELEAAVCRPDSAREPDPFLEWERVKRIAPVLC